MWDLRGAAGGRSPAGGALPDRGAPGRGRDGPRVSRAFAERAGRRGEGRPARIGREPGVPPQVRPRGRHGRRVNGFFTARVVDADPQGSPPWLATAYVPGMSLEDAVGEHGPWPEESVLALAAGLAEALESIHAAGVVHRDLKPSNVLLAGDGPRVIDFGISLAAEGGYADEDRHHHGHPRVHVPGAAQGHPGRTGERRVLPGARAGVRRDGHRAVRAGVMAGAVVSHRPRGARPRRAAAHGADAGRAVPGQGARGAAGPVGRAERTGRQRP